MIQKIIQVYVTITIMSWYLFTFYVRSFFAKILYIFLFSFLRCIAQNLVYAY